MKEGRFLRDGPQGQVAQWAPDEGAHLRSWQQSQIDDHYDGRLQDPGIVDDPRHRFDIPVLRKRTAEERLESMIRRLAVVHPVQQAALLQQIAGDYWKAGMPVTQEALRKAAADLLNRNDKRITTASRR